MQDGLRGPPAGTPGPMWLEGTQLKTTRKHTVQGINFLIQLYDSHNEVKCVVPAET